VALVLSVLVHTAVMWQRLPQLHRAPSELADTRDGRSALSVQLAPRPVPPSARAQPLPIQPQQPAPHVRAERAKPAPRAQSSPPTIALNTPTPSVPAAPAAPTARAPPAPDPARTPADADLASYVEARRRQRAESAPSAGPAEAPSVAQPAEDDNARANRIAAANLGLDRKPTFGSDTSRGGGIFSIQRMSYDYAEFLFFGWNKDIRRNTTQTIEVRKGGNSDIRIAVVRRMIGIIREYEDGDTAGLEDFMKREFFGDASRP
jgi:hypothetical protein